MRLTYIPFFLLLSLFIYSSDNASSEQLRMLAERLNEPEAQQLLFKSASLGNPLAASRLLAFAENAKNEYWLTQVAHMPNTFGDAGVAELGQANPKATLNAIKSRAAYALANNSELEGQKRYWFAFASQLNHPQSQFELSLMLHDDAQRLQLLHDSADNGYVPAVITLGQYYHHNVANLDSAFSGDSEWVSSLPSALQNSEQNTDIDSQQISQEDENRALALYWLERSAHYDGTSAFDLAMLQWHLGKSSAAAVNFELAASLGNEKAKQYTAVLNQQEVRPISDVFLSNAAKNPNSRANWCSQQLQFVASGLTSVVQAREIKKQFEQDKRFNSLSICINPVAWVPKTALACKNQSINARIKCDLSAFANVKKMPSFTHLVVFAETGKAYVQRGVMYLDRSDEYSVFVHELAHFAAFVDEYPLSSNMARIHCQSPTAPNLMVSSDSEELDQALMQRWQSVSGKSVPVAVSKTCQRQDGVTSFKPSSSITFLEHHDTEYIPPLYLALWQQQLAKRDEAIGAKYEFLHLASKSQQAETISHWQALLGN